jgi:CelD/BcsL family acetyltransferase involved in cellulose biosynthesis
VTVTLASVPEAPLAGDPSELEVRVLPATSRAQAAAIWSGAAAAGWGATGFASWTWTQTWLERFGDIVDHRFVVATRDGEPRAIALVTAGAGRGWRPRTAHVGTAGEPRGSGVFVERNHIVADPRDRTAFLGLLGEELDRDPRWDRLLLDGLDPDDARALAARWPGAAVTTEECPITDLPLSGDVLDGLTSSRRRRARATLRAFGDLDVEWAQDADQARDIFAELIALHQSHWTARGAAGAFSDERFTAFHRDYVQAAVPAGEAALVRVRRGDETVGCLYGLIDDRRLRFYQGGLRGYDDNRLRSGLAAHVCFMRACAARGITQYDFLAPATRYKLELATRTEDLAWIEVERGGWRTRASRIARRVRRTS